MEILGTVVTPASVDSCIGVFFTHFIVTCLSSLLRTLAVSSVIQYNTESPGFSAHPAVESQVAKELRSGPFAVLTPTPGWLTIKY